MNSKGSEPCQVLSNVSIVAYSTLVSDRMRSSRAAEKAE